VRFRCVAEGNVVRVHASTRRVGRRAAVRCVVANVNDHALMAYSATAWSCM
jgi:hypothetical protein